VFGREIDGVVRDDLLDELFDEVPGSEDWLFDDVWDTDDCDCCDCCDEDLDAARLDVACSADVPIGR
jgi:hypothetical protein